MSKQSLRELHKSQRFSLTLEIGNGTAIQMESVTLQFATSGLKCAGKTRFVFRNVDSMNDPAAHPVQRKIRCTLTAPSATMSLKVAASISNPDGPASSSAANWELLLGDFPVDVKQANETANSGADLYIREK